MIKTKYSNYPTYKDSGVKWLGQIPENWELKRIKFIFNEINQRSLNGSGDLLSVSHYTGVTKKSDKVGDGDLLTNAETLEGYKKVSKGDLVSNIMLAWNGSLGFSSFSGITSPAYSIYRLSSDNNKQYFHYLLRTDLYKSEFKRESTGVIESRLRLYTDDFFRIWSILPPHEEQTAIANFLDDKTAIIDQAIAQKEKLIELLKERKQIIIQNAVTKGLDENVKLKDSGVEWIGEIPEHWGIIKTKRVARKITDGEHISPIFTDSGMPFLSAKDIREGYIEFPNNKFVKIRDGRKFRERCNPERGDILLVSRGATIGRVSKVETDVEFCLLGSVILIKPNQKIFVDYLVRAIGNKLLQETFLNTSHHSAQQAIYIVKVAEVFIPIPSKEEQIEIVSYIKTQSTKIDKAITLQQSQIEKLKEYKATLIDSAVTGKIKVC